MLSSCGCSTLLLHHAFSWLLCICLLSASGSCQRMSLGRCPEVRPMRDFDINKFTGDWVEVERSFYLIEAPVACTRVNFTMADNTSLHVDITYKSPWRRTNSTTRYVADYTSDQGIINMVLKSNMPSFLARLTPGSGKYVVLDTDYSEYALIYSCTNFRFVHADFIWVLGRSVDITPEMRAKLYSILDKYEINRDRLLITPRKEC